MNRFHFNSQAALWRQVYTGNVSTLTDQSIDYFGFFQPIDSDTNTVALGITSQAYQFVADGSADIGASDVLVIDDTQYRVRGIRRHRMLSQDFLICIMELSVRT